MAPHTVRDRIENAWTLVFRENRRLEPDQALHAAMDDALQQMDQGVWPVVTFEKGEPVVHAWLKKAILLYFRLVRSRFVDGNNQTFFDKIPLKTASWSQETFEAQHFRMVTGAVVRRSAFIGERAVIMPCFVNVGAWIGVGTVVESMASIGSCARVGDRCHLSDGVCLGNMLEPVNALPVIVEDDCFIGPRCTLTEGVRVGHGTVMGPGVHLNMSTRIFSVATGEVSYGAIPPCSVVVDGTLPDPRGFHARAAVIVKTIDEHTRQRMPVVDLLRDL
jgi:2,3,4,5-tetrahydropyridine-2-carboxylate N-succinyltransferase